ncbi:MAG: zinc ribbon domain-containing protein [Sediminibacterium sp.]
MKNTSHCQSCNMPIDKPVEKGTEKDGTLNSKYCRYCYREGSFVNPELTFGEMKSIVTMQLMKTHLSMREADRILLSLPGISRWKTTVETE